MPRSLLPVFCAVLIWCCSAPLCRATAQQAETVDQANAVYQFGVEIPKLSTDPMFPGKTSAFLWVPPHVRHLRAVLLAPANIIERRVADSPIIRAEATRDSFGIVFFQAGWGKGAMDSPALADYVQAMLDALADQSGYEELKTTPWIPLGHSGNSQFVQGIARLRPERVVASVVIKGGLPAVAKDGSTKGIVGIPTFFCNGEYEEVMPPGNVRNAWWGVSIQRFNDVKKVVPEALYMGIEDKGHGHIHWLDGMQNYLALYLHKAMMARVDGDSTHLKAVDFASGWLADPQEKVAFAPEATYKGDRSAAFWFFDTEQVRAWKALYSRDEGKKDQMLAFEQDGEITPLWKGWGLQTIAFQPQADGVTFQVKARFRDEVPAPFADAGTKLGHAASGAITYQVVGWAGATEQVGPDTFRVRFDREGDNGRTTHILIGALQPGDANYRETVAVATFDIPGSNTAGTKQAIHFAKIANQPAGTQRVGLQATSDAGLPVGYYISWGPAQIKDNAIVLTELPNRAQYPIAVRVTAYQWGKATAPAVASAGSVTQTFFITGPSKTTKR